MELKKLFNIFTLFLVFLTFGITENIKIDKNYIQFVDNIAPLETLDYSTYGDLQQKAGYNFIITSFELQSNCIQVGNCGIGNREFIISDWTNSGTIEKNYSFGLEKENIELIKEPLKISGYIFLENLSTDNVYNINLTGYYLDENDNIFFRFYNNNKDNLYFYLSISFILTLLFYIYLPYFFWKNGFKIGKDYLIKKRKDDTN